MVSALQSYGRETTLLAGTAVSMVITAAASPEESVHCFFSVFSTINNSTYSVFPDLI